MIGNCFLGFQLAIFEIKANWSYSEAVGGLSEVVNNIHPIDLISLQGGSVKTYNYYQMAINLKTKTY